MEIERYEDGVPSWVDLSTPDLEGARSFYSELFGWQAQVGPPEAGGYTICLLRDRPVAGLGPSPMEGVPPSWTTYVNVEDADAVAAKVSPNGGNVLMGPMDVMDVGRMAIVADPVGAVIGIWQAGTHKGAGLVNEPNTYCWSELVTTDLPGAKAFYASVFGWGAESHGEDESAYVEWKLSGRSIGGLMLKPPTIPAEVPPYWGVYFAVDDADRAAARVGELGGSVMMGPTDIEPGRFAVAADPAGAVFCVLQLKPELAG